MERERKFLVEKLPAGLSRFPHKLIQQGYLILGNGSPEQTEVRIRQIDKKHVLTVKKGLGALRLEKEAALSPESARIFWPLTRGKRVKKVRYKIPYRHLTIELDVYGGNARGLRVAEVEFPSDRALKQFEPPGWFGRDVTGHRAFSNSEIAVKGWKRGKSSRRTTHGV